ncbi:hypothetical protein SDC9_200321 [bioreactor metagenome]|uniref:Uncharacterized protein n=1 Tax=bioreactor metagenome TaxID=1076179 RepID=A0A645IQP7_9ZZZZ
MVWKHGIENKSGRSYVKKAYHEIEQKIARARDRYLYIPDTKDMPSGGGFAGAEDSSRHKRAAGRDERSCVLRPAEM